MKKVLSTLFAFALIALSFTSCSSNSPEGVVEKFLDAAQDKDFTEMIECLGLNEEDSKQAEAIFQLTFAKVDLVDYEIVETKMADDEKSATVIVKQTLKMGDEEETETADIDVSLNKDGNWCVDMM